MRQDEKVRFGGRAPLTFKDNGLVATLRRYGKTEHPLTGFAELVEVSGLERALKARPYTLLVPQNAALAGFKRPPTPEALKTFIWDHVVEGRLTLGGPGSRERYTFPRDGRFKTMAGHQLTVARGGDGKWLITGGAPGAARVMEVDLPFEPGVLHVIDRTSPVSTPTRID